MASSVGPDATASLIELVMMKKLENPRKKINTSTSPRTLSPVVAPRKTASIGTIAAKSVTAQYYNLGGEKLIGSKRHAMWMHLTFVEDTGGERIVDRGYSPNKFLDINFQLVCVGYSFSSITSDR